MGRNALPIASVLALLWSGVAFAGPAGDDLEAVEMRLGKDKYITVYRYGGRTYEKIDPEKLRSAALAGKLVCVEGKFGNVSGSRFTLMTTSIQFLPRNRKAVANILRGDNVWVSGEVKRQRSRAECYLLVDHVVKLKDDFALFEERYSKYKKEKNWRKLWELGKWIEATGKINVANKYRGFERYKEYSRRAYRQSLVLRAESLSSKDAEGFYGIAVKLFDIEGSKRDGIRYLRKAVEIDPDHVKAGERLKGYGFLRHKDQWVTKTMLDRIKQQEKLDEEKRKREEAERKRKEAARLAMMRRNREVLLYDLYQKTRLGTEQGLTETAKYLGDHEDDVLCRAVLFEVTNANEPQAVDGFLKAAGNPSAEVRCDLADALAWRGDDHSRGLVVSMIGSDSNPAKVRIHAVEALVWMGGKGAVESLMGLVAEESAEVRKKVFAGLTALTGKAHKDADEWTDWWNSNRDDFEPKR